MKGSILVKLTPLIVSIVTFVGYVDTHSLHPFLSTYAKELGADVVMIGIIIAAYSFFQDVLEIPAGYFMDRRGKRKLLLSVGLTLDAMSMILYSISTTPHHLLGVRILHGLGGAFMGPAMMSLMADVPHPLARMGARMGVYGFPIGLASTVGWFLGGVIVLRIGYRSLFYSICLALLVVAALSLLIKEPEPFALSTSKLSIREALSRLRLLIGNRDYSAACYAIFAHMATLGAIVTLLPSYADQLGLTSAHVGIVFMAFGISWIVFQIPMGMLSDKIGRKIQLITGLFMIGASLIILGFATAFPVMALAMTVYGIGYSVLFPSVAAMALESAGPGDRSLASAFFHILYTQGVVFGALMFALVASYLGYAGGLQWSVVMPISALIATVGIRGK
jgi:MFS family permease